MTNNTEFSKISIEEVAGGMLKTISYNYQNKFNVVIKYNNENKANQIFFYAPGEEEKEIIIKDKLCS